VCELQDKYWYADMREKGTPVSYTSKLCSCCTMKSRLRYGSNIDLHTTITFSNVHGVNYIRHTHTLFIFRSHLQLIFTSDFFVFLFLFFIFKISSNI
jgi:hypothetical protein